MNDFPDTQRRASGSECLLLPAESVSAAGNFINLLYGTIHRERNVSKSNTGSETDDGSGLTESPDRPGVYRTQYDPDGPGTASDTVIQAIAEVADVDPTNTVIPLADRIDPDALNSLFADREGNAQTTFHVCGLEVLVRSDGRVRIVDDSVSDTD